MDRIELFEKTIEAFHRYFGPPGTEYLPGQGEMLRRLLDLERRLRAGNFRLSEEEEGFLRCFGGPMGPLGGLAVHDVSDNELRHLLCVAEDEARKMKRSILWWRGWGWWRRWWFWSWWWDK